MDMRVVLWVLSRLSLFFAGIITIPLGAAAFSDAEHVWIFALTLVIAVLLGKLLSFFGSRRSIARIKVREAVAVMGFGWGFVCVLGALPYFFYGLYDPTLALFESVAGLSTTGITALASYSEFSTSILVWRLLTHFCGGLGVILFFIMVLPHMSGSNSYLFNAELSNGMVQRAMPRIKESVYMLAGTYFSLHVLIVILLILGGMSFAQACNMAVATVATGGVTFYHDGLLQYANLYEKYIIIIFMLVGSTNFAIYYRVWKGDWQALTKNSELRCYFGILLSACALLTFDFIYEGGADATEALNRAVFYAVSFGSTAGFAIDDYTLWPSFSQYVLFTLLFIGGCCGSTGGGIKVVRFLILLKTAWAELLYALHPRMQRRITLNGEALPARVVGNTTRFFLIYIFGFMVLSVLLSLTGYEMLDSMGMIAAAISNTGSAFGHFGPTAGYVNLNGAARLVMVLSMMLGRLEFFSILILLRPDFWQKRSQW